MMTNLKAKINSSKMKVNYSLLMEQEIEKIKQSGTKPTLILHSCCAPCSSHVLSVLQKYFCITIFFYNPNIYPKEEYILRKAELIKLINILNAQTDEKEKNNSFEDGIFHETKIELLEAPYNPQEFYDIAKSYENLPEGDKRCYLCYTLRLKMTAKQAKEKNFDYFCTTLTVSPYKNADWLNEIGNAISKTEKINFLQSDFKKNEGYKHSIELSQKYGLYRQHYCGCEYSLLAMKEYMAKKQNKI